MDRRDEDDIYEGSACRIAFVGQRALDVLALGPSGVEVVAACSGTGEHKALQARGVRHVACTEDTCGYRAQWTNADLGSVPLGALNAAVVRCDGAAIRVFSYAAASEITSFCNSNLGLMLAGIAPALKAALDDKLAVRRAWRRLSIPTPPTLPIAAGRSLRGVEMQWPAVLQRTRGSSGIGSFLVQSPSEVMSLVDQQGSWMLSPFCGKTTLNFHAVVTSAGARVSAPSVQVIGLPELATHPLAYSGNDFAAADELDPEILSSAREVVSRIAAWLRVLGYRGIFGTDVLLTAEGPLALEINPRFQGSSWLLAELELLTGSTPLGAYHRRAVTGGRDPGGRQPDLLQGAQLVVHAREASRVVHRLHLGLHRPEDGGFVAYEPRLELSQVGPGGVLICDLPLSGTRIAAGAVLGRIAAREPLTRDGGQGLNALGRHAVSWLRAQMAANGLATSGG